LNLAFIITVAFTTYGMAVVPYARRRGERALISWVVVVVDLEYLNFGLHGIVVAVLGRVVVGERALLCRELPGYGAALSRQLQLAL
jgi:hypothetical protein